MALSATWINASAGSPSYDAATLRALDSILETPEGTDPLDSRQGVRIGSGNPLKVTNSGLTYSVAAGSAVVSKRTQGAIGAYRVTNTATVSGSIPAADATYARRDVVVLKVQDTDVDGSGQRSTTIVYRAGTPAASPSYPAVNAGEFLLAYVDLPANSTSPTITDKRVFTVASGGVLPIFQTADLPTNPYEGQIAWDARSSIYGGAALSVYTAGAWVEIYRDSGWQAISLDSPWTPFGGGFQSPRWRRRQGITYVQGLIAATSVSTTQRITLLPPAATGSGAHASATILTGCYANVASTQSVRRVDIGSDGSLTYQDTAGAVAWLALNLSFPSA